MENKATAAINYRLTQLSELLTLIKQKPDSFPFIKIETEARIDELHSLLYFLEKQTE